MTLVCFRSYQGVAMQFLGCVEGCYCLIMSKKKTHSSKCVFSCSTEKRKPLSLERHDSKFWNYFIFWWTSLVIISYIAYNQFFCLRKSPRAAETLEASLTISPLWCSNDHGSRFFCLFVSVQIWQGRIAKQSEKNRCRLCCFVLCSFVFKKDLLCLRAWPLSICVQVCACVTVRACVRSNTRSDERMSLII